MKRSEIANLPPHARAEVERQRAEKPKAAPAHTTAESFTVTLPWPAATIQATFYHAQARRRDSDNLAASLKSAVDGPRLRVLAYRPSPTVAPSAAPGTLRRPSKGRRRASETRRRKY